MTLPAPPVDTVPYCGACGWKPFSVVSRNVDLNDDFLCDSCGADLVAYGWTAGLLPPTVLTVDGDTPLAGDVTVTWNSDIATTSSDVQWRLDNGVWTIIVGATSPEVILAATIGGAGKVDVQVRNNEGLNKGPWSVIVSTTVT